MRKNLISKIWTELTRVRAVKFISYETEEEQNTRLQAEFKDRIINLKMAKKEKLMQERIIPYFRDLELSQSGMLLSDECLRKRAEASLNLAIAEGRVDEFFNIVGAESEVQ